MSDEKELQLLRSNYYAKTEKPKKIPNVAVYHYQPFEYIISRWWRD